MRRHEFEVVRVKAKNSQQPPEPREIAANDSLQVWHPAKPPVLEMFHLQEVHFDQHVDRRHKVFSLEDRRHCADDAWSSGDP